MFKNDADSTLLTTLQKMSEVKKLTFTLGCLERLPLQTLFNRNDAMLFADALVTMNECLNKDADEEVLAEFIIYMTERCSELHNASSEKIHLISDKYNLRARSYAADALYGAAEIVYHHLTERNCPINIMHVLENIRLSQKWQANNNPQRIDEESSWQVGYADNILSNKVSDKKPIADIIKFPFLE